MAIGRSSLRAGRQSRAQTLKAGFKQTVLRRPCVAFSLSAALSLSDLSLQGEIRLSYGSAVNPSATDGKMGISRACRQKVSWMKMVAHKTNLHL